MVKVKKVNIKQWVDHFEEIFPHLEHANLLDITPADADLPP